MDTRAAFNGDSHGQRHRLLPVLHAVQNRIGWISPGALNYVALRLDVAPADVHGVASFYGMFSLEPRPLVVAHVCDDIACLTQGSQKLCAELERRLGPAGSPCSDGRAIWLRSQCLGLCDRAPAALISSAGKNIANEFWRRHLQKLLQSLIDDAIAGRLPAEAGRSECPGRAFRKRLSKAESGPLRFLHRFAEGGAATLRVIAELGWLRRLAQGAWNLALKARCANLTASKLLGRGGAAFPTAKKWEALFQQRQLLSEILLARTTSSAMRMNPNLARSKTASSWKAIPLPCSKA